ncbi:hypothetical protein FRB91_010117 [Serendipita sp. 411]|nr:hypothetical protein FRB91_010117 [Serendipita sp. 411]
MPPRKATKAKQVKGKKRADSPPVEDAEMHDSDTAAQTAVAATASVAIQQPSGDTDDIVDGDMTASGSEGPGVAKKATLTPQERAVKMAALREKMRASAIANRRDLIEESNRAKHNAKELARLERKRQLAETLREKIEARETGEDLERKRNWEYSIEEDHEWTKKMEKKKRRADFEFHDHDSNAHRKYKKDLDLLNPDLITYNLRKERALNLEPGTLVEVDESGKASLTLAAKDQAIMMSAAAASGVDAEGLYRDANSLSYADNKPSEEAIDRVVNKLNNDLDKRGKWSRKRTNEDEGDITYINERNKVFNKKASFDSDMLITIMLTRSLQISRFYDKYTTEIRDSFERGTAV